MYIHGDSIYLAVTFLSSSTAVLAAVQPDGQCGGMNFDDETLCAEGWTCTKYHDSYSHTSTSRTRNVYESPSYAKPKGFAAAVEKWVAAGVPIDGVGSQSQSTGNSTIADFPAVLKLGCADVSIEEYAITELDIKGASSSDYTTAVDACLDQDNCVGLRCGA
ncbi:hypothetical protein BDU57DRAFT_530701 [Ampelomyces quisqualis]|uniref:Uncharacterized protein n=1 Tax=Ampelomyces quisqualis TaxID=50730 RepID=A0A6A5QI14_AMPQU|nr:hypothetical protein BDU57DRAFT_530701 [Ampelomyces quisqualis]